MSDKSIIRVSKNKDNPYVMLNKEFLSDPKLSWRAKGMLTYLLSKPDNWQVNPNDLIKKSKDGRDAVYACLNELIEVGYIERNKIRNEKGHFSHIEYLVFEVHKTSRDNKVSPFTDIPYTGKPHLVKPIRDAPDIGNPIMENPDNINNDLGLKDLDLPNTHTNNYKTIINNQSINQFIKSNDETDRLIDDVTFILTNLEIQVYPTKIQKVIKNALTDMYVSDNFSKANNIDLTVVRTSLIGLKNNQIDSCINNFAEASKGTKISAPMKYFEKCLWNAIIDDELNDSGIFNDVFTDE